MRWLDRFFKELGRTIREAIVDTPRTIRFAFLVVTITAATVILRSV